MSEIYNASNTDWFNDYLVFNKGAYELKRRYVRGSLEEGGQYVHDWPDSPDIPIVAKGISAYLSYENRFELSMSLRERIRHGEKYYSDNYCLRYFNLCFNYLSDENGRGDEDYRKSDQMLIEEHVSKEETYFKDTSTLFVEVRDWEVSSIEIIKKTTNRYPEWVRKNRLPQTKPARAKRKNNDPDKLIDVFDSISKYKTIMSLLVNKGYCESNTYIWKDVSGGSKGTLVVILITLHLRGYYKMNRALKSDQIKKIALNTFGQELSIPLVKKVKKEMPTLYFTIPEASTIP